MKKFLTFLLALISSFVIGLMIFFLSYQIAVTISPPYTIIDGKKYCTMPMGQVFIATIISVVAGIILLIFLYKYFRKKLFFRNRC